MELERKVGARWHLVDFGAALASVVTAACSTGPAQEPSAGGKEARSVRTAVAIERIVNRTVSATGTFGPKDEIALSFKIGGVVESVLVDTGGRVEAGHTLASLHLREIDAMLAKARSGAQKAERDLRRAERLFADSVVTLAQLQDAETAYEIAAADFEAADFNRGYAQIVAPYDGVILDRAVEPGETVEPGATILILGSRDRGAVVRVGLADRDVVRVSIGDPAIATFHALPGRSFRGSVSEVGAAATTGLGTFAVEIALDDAAALFAGMVGRVEITPSGGVLTAVIPVEAILEADGNQAHVFVLDADGRTARSQVVSIDLLPDGEIAVFDGVQAGTTVVTAGAAWLTDGDEVRVIR